MKTTLIILALLVLPGVAAPNTSEDFSEIMKAYESIRLVLLQDQVEGIDESAELIRKKARQAAKAETTAEEVRPHLEKIAGFAEGVAAAEDLELTRGAFYELSKIMVQYRSKLSGDDLPVVVYCPMAKKSWLQLDDEVGNPYYGQAMAACGNVVSDN